MFSRIIIPLGLALAMGACVAPSQPLLDSAQAGCATGHADMCGIVPVLQARVNAEQNQQAAAVALGILGVVAVAADAALSDPYCCYVPRYHFHRHYWR